MGKVEICMNPTKPETQEINRADNIKLIGAGAIVVIALAAFYLFANYSLLMRVIGLLAAFGGAVVLALKTELGAETLEFIQGPRAEVRKVVWPTRAETTQTTSDRHRHGGNHGLVAVVAGRLLFWLIRLITG
jgi:preprotein translocase subunit SecE